MIIISGILLTFCVALFILTARQIKDKYIDHNRLVNWHYRALADIKALNDSSRELYEAIVSAMFFAGMAVFFIVIMYTGWK